MALVVYVPAVVCYCFIRAQQLKNNLCAYTNMRKLGFRFTYFGLN